MIRTLIFFAISLRNSTIAYQFILFIIYSINIIVFIGVPFSLAAPSAGPARIVFPRRNSTYLLATWIAPREDKRNGVIIRYGLCYKLETESGNCVNYATTKNTWFEFGGLRPYQMVKFAIKAGTAVGFGPARFAKERTLQAGEKKCFKVDRKHTSL